MRRVYTLRAIANPMKLADAGACLHSQFRSASHVYCGENRNAIVSCKETGGVYFLEKGQSAFFRVIVVPARVPHDASTGPYQRRRVSAYSYLYSGCPS